MQESTILRRKTRSRYHHTNNRSIEPAELITLLLLVFNTERYA